jgi:hypothetical protein
MRHTQNRRSRGRSRKAPNPLTRSYESNGPDVKVRGTAPHVAEKYMTLARDALSAGDTVSAESYLQHAEHYNRIVAAAQQAQFQQAQQAQQRDGSDGGRDDERASSGSGSDQGNDDGHYQRDSRFESVGDVGADDGDDAIPAQQERDATGGGDDKAERQRRPRRPRVEASNDESAASSKPNASAPGDAAVTDTPKPNGRRRKPAAEKATASPAEDPVVAEADADADTTQDGAAALAAFPD